MTLLLYQTDSYLRESDAAIIAIDEEGVILDQTPFYPGGGGQPDDHGHLLLAGGSRCPIVGLRKQGGRIVHLLGSAHDVAIDDPARAAFGTADSGSRDDTHPRTPADSARGTLGVPGTADSRASLAPGQQVHAVIDWERRYRLMRTHTALHILCGVVFRDFGVPVTGGNMEPLRGRLDFELESLEAERVAQIEAACNEEIRAARPIIVRILPRAEAFQIPDLIRTKINLLPPGIEEVRTVDIVGLDLQADGGTHVANTREVGLIRVTDYKSKGKGNKRIAIAVEDQ